MTDRRPDSGSASSLLHRFTRYSMVVALLAIASTGCWKPESEGTSSGGGVSPGGVPSPPVIYGYVWMDSTTVGADAEVFTDPPSDVVYANEEGYFEITRGLQPGEYMIRAELNGVQGRTMTDGAIHGGQNGPVSILLGDLERSWRPGLATDNSTGGATIGARGRPVRCCQ